MSQLGSNGTVGASFLTEAEAAEKQLEEIREGVAALGVWSFFGGSSTRTCIHGGM